MRPIIRSAIALVVVYGGGVIGFWLVGDADTTWLDAVYMTAITLTTVGYQEAVTLSGNPAGQVFATVLLLLGVGTFVYFFSNVTAFAVEGTLDRLFWRRRMARLINDLTDHVIVCGAGDTGEHAVAELVETHRPFVLIERDDAAVQQLYARFGVEFPVVVGDATEDDALERAGIARAAGLLVCFSSDKDNLVVTFSARNINPDMRIVVRCMHPRDEPKLRRAGADSVVYPDKIGGLRLVSELVRPAAVTFLDAMLRDRDRRFRVEAVKITPTASIVGKTIGELRGRELSDTMVLAIKDASGQWRYNPGDDEKLASGMQLVFIGTPEVREAVEQAARPR